MGHLEMKDSEGPLQNPMRASGTEVILDKHCYSRRQFFCCSPVARFIELIVQLLWAQDYKW